MSASLTALLLVALGLVFLITPTAASQVLLDDEGILHLTSCLSERATLIDYTVTPSGITQITGGKFCRLFL